MSKDKNKLTNFKLVNETITGHRFNRSPTVQHFLLLTKNNDAIPENPIDQNNILTKITQRIYLRIATKILMETAEHYQSFFTNIQNSLAQTQILLNESFKNDQQISQQPMLINFIENNALTLERTKRLLTEFTIEKSALFTISKKIL